MARFSGGVVCGYPFGFTAIMMTLLMLTPTSNAESLPSDLSIGKPLPTPFAINKVEKSGGGKIFYTHLDNAGMGFFQAIGFCYGNQLLPAIITSAAEEQILWNFLNSLVNNTQYNTRPFYLSLNDVENEGTFLWLGSYKAVYPLTYKNWAPNSPVPAANGGRNLNCVSAQQLSYEGSSQKFGWINLPCSTKWRPLCMDKF